MRKTYPLLRQFSRSLFFAVAEEFDDTAFVWCESVDQFPKSQYAFLIQILLFYASNSRDRFGPVPRVGMEIGIGNGMAYPATSLTTSLTNAVLLLK